MKAINGYIHNAKTNKYEVLMYTYTDTFYQEYDTFDLAFDKVNELLKKHYKYDPNQITTTIGNLIEVKGQKKSMKLLTSGKNTITVKKL